MTCPCNSRSDDSETASSIFSPVLSSTKPLARHIEKNGELKPLLEPEVDLASSMLETLREATEEEYKEALVRDAARSAIQSVEPDALIDGVVAIVNSADAPENLDIDTVPEASNNQDSRCAYSLSGEYDNNILGRSNSPLSSRESLSQALDLNFAPNNLYNNFNLPNTLELPRRPLQALTFSPIGNRGFLPANRLNPFAINTRQPALNLRQLLSIQRPLDLSNLMNLRDVELVPPRKVSIMRPPHTEEIVHKTKNPIYEPAIDASNMVLSKIPEISNIHDTDDCLPNGSQSRQKNNIHTKILSSVPSSQEPNIVQSNFDKLEDNDNHRHTLPHNHKNLVPSPECFNGNPSFSRNSPEEHDPLTEENRNSLSILTLQNEANKAYHVKPESYLSQQDNIREDPSASLDGTNTQHFNGIASMKNNVIKTLEDFRQANAMIHENLRSSLDDVLSLDKKESLNDEYSSSNTMDKHFKEDRSSKSFKYNLSIEDLQQMSDKILSKNNNKESIQKSNGKSYKIFDNMNHNQNTAPVNVENSNLDLERESTNVECIIRDSANNHPQRFYKDNNEMNVAASEPINTRFRANQYLYNIPNRKNINRSPMVEDPLEDINLDIFQYQPHFKDVKGVKKLQLPKFNMKSYKTQLPIPNSLDLKPVKLQKAIRKGSDILGATLTMKPHATQRSFGSNNKMRTSQNGPNGLGIPDIEDIRSFLESNAQNILNLPFLGVGSDDNCGSGMRSDNMIGNVRSFAEEAITNVQESLGKTFKEAKGANSRPYPLIRDTVLNPTDVIETIAEAHGNANDKLRNFQLDLNDRLKKIHQSLISQSRTSSPSILQQRERTPSRDLQPNRVNRKNNPNTSLFANPRDNRPESSLSSVIDKDSKSRGSILTQNPALPPLNSRAPNPLSSHKSITTNKRTDSVRPGQKVNTKRPLPLRERLKLARENKGIISITTTKKPPIVESLSKLKPLSARNSIALPKKDNIPNQPRWILPESNASARKQINREPKTSPSDISYTKTLPKTSNCDENNAQTLGESSRGRNSESTTETSPERSNKKTILPNLAENTFLSKVKETVTPKHLSRPLSRNNNYDTTSNDYVIPSPTEVQRINIEPSNGITFDCKMVCSKN
ncbi:uncharacterized protein LOC119835691 [Zerene cesonia]|uniref:uncharacterized protein LOC119835691 n=1 Tax=Zerene cesonia TaxID=33412 RepID=UPI0018E52BF5|nr:uncharacterized protein LOC119835691 [Zerene cesonia]